MRISFVCVDYLCYVKEEEEEEEEEEVEEE
jgi:hypothetical protein